MPHGKLTNILFREILAAYALVFPLVFPSPAARAHSHWGHESSIDICWGSPPPPIKNHPLASGELFPTALNCGMNSQVNYDPPFQDLCTHHKKKSCHAFVLREIYLSGLISMFSMTSVMFTTGFPLFIFIPSSLWTPTQNPPPSNQIFSKVLLHKVRQDEDRIWPLEGKGPLRENHPSNFKQGSLWCQWLLEKKLRYLI